MILKLLYKPFGITFGLLGGLVARRLFNVLWSRVDDREPPKPTTKDTSMARLLGAEGLRAATFAITRAAFDRAGARTFFHVSGRWPGERQKS